MATNIDEYIAAFPPDVQQILQRIRQTVRNAAPNAEETISYAMPAVTRWPTRRFRPASSSTGLAM